jgi:serine/threonine protein kinase
VTSLFPERDSETKAAKMVSKYHVMKPIGEGAQGRVFLVRERNPPLVKDEVTGQLKKERRDWVMKVVPLPKKEKEREACIREGSTMMKLSHPNVVGCKVRAMWSINLGLSA